MGLRFCRWCRLQPMAVTISRDLGSLAFLSPRSICAAWSGCRGWCGSSPGEGSRDDEDGYSSRRRSVSVAIVVPHRGRAALELLRSERHVQIMIEVVLERRDPPEAPSHPLPEALDLRQRRTRNRDEAHVAVIEVDGDAVEIVASHATSDPSFFSARAASHAQQLANGRAEIRRRQTGRAAGSLTGPAGSRPAAHRAIATW